MQADIVLHYTRNCGEIKATLIWDFDGSFGHSAYKQKFNSKNADVSDENLFTTLIPVLLLTANNSILGNNKVSQSSRFCRPIKLQYIKKSAEVIISQKRFITNK